MKNKLNTTLLNSTANIIFLLNSSNKIQKSNKAFKDFFPNKKTVYKILKNKNLFFKYMPKNKNKELLNNFDFSKWLELLLLNKINKIMFLKDNEEHYFKIEIIAISNKQYVITMNDITLFEQNLMQIKLVTMGKLLSGITHEINTPITYIKSNIELIEDSITYLKNINEFKKENIESIEAIYDGINRIENIIESVKNISSKAKKQKEKINIYKSLVYSMRIIYNRAKNITPMYINDKRFDLNLDTNYEIFEALVLKEKIEQIWLILLNNACDEFSKSTLDFEKRKILIYISKIKNKTKIIFKDNANKGINKNIINKIFEPFISTKTQDGMGLGLNIAKNIVDEHKGSIKAYNEDNYAVFEVVI